jgi:ATP-dependent RNA helicase DeaD
MQVAEAIHKYARGVGLTVLPLYGGAPMHQQIAALQRGAHVVVATPGRALDHMRRTTLQLEGVRVLVLDEADEMLDMGFSEDLDAILKATPGTQQTALFSATMPARILAIAGRHLKSPARVTIAREKTAAGKAPHVRQVAYIVNRAHKPATLARILDMEDPVATVVFCRTRMEVESLVENIDCSRRSKASRERRSRSRQYRRSRSSERGRST